MDEGARNKKKRKQDNKRNSVKATLDFWPLSYQTLLQDDHAPESGKPSSCLTISDVRIGERFAKVYANEKEQQLRFETFVENLGRAFLDQLADPFATYDAEASPLADWTQEEYNKRNSLRPPSKDWWCSRR